MEAPSPAPNNWPKPIAKLVRNQTAEKTRTERFDKDSRIERRRLKWANCRLMRPLGEKTKRAAAPIRPETTPDAPITTTTSPQ